MSTKDTNTKTLRFSDDIDEKLKNLAQKFGRGKQHFFEQMVNYFHRTKKDPTDINDEILKNTLVKNHDTYIRFIRAQEEKVLIPVKTEVDRMIESQIKILDCFNTQILKSNKDLLSNQQMQVLKFKETDQLLKTILDKLVTTENLKLKFMYILNNYIRARDQFGMMTSAKEKDELIQETRQQVTNL